MGYLKENINLIKILTKSRLIKEENKGYKIIKSNQRYIISVKEIDDEKYKDLNQRMKCQICGREYWSHKVGRYFAQTCQSCNLYIYCSNSKCKKENLVLDHPSRILKSIIEENKISSCDKRCSDIAKLERSKRKICPNCGGNKFNILGICMNCHNNNINKSITCKIHGYQEHSFAGKCIKCINDQKDRLVELAIKNCEKANNGYWKTEEGIKIKIKIGKENLQIKNKFCEKCNFETPHRGNNCLICNPNCYGSSIPYIIKIDNFCKTHNSSFLVYIKELNQFMCYECYKEKYNNNQIDILISNCKCVQCSKFCEINENFCSKDCEKIYEEDKYQTFRRNNKCEKHSNEILTYHGECWSCFKEKYKENNNINSNNNYGLKILPKSLICKQCGKVINNPNDKFCSDECKKIYEEDKFKSFKRNNNCKKHPNEILTYNSKYWSCYKEESLMNENLIIPNSCKCMNCNKIIDPNNNGFCDEKCKIEFTQSHKSMFKEGNKCKKHPDENLIYGKVCWSCYKEFINNYKNFKDKNEFLIKIQKDYPNAYIQSTFRNQDSEDWTGASLAFEQDLVDKNIGYFVYIKFYINVEDINLIPLVVGKSGSKLVNDRGSDVNFSMNINHGPARKFLNEEGLEWDKTKILIIPCESEKEAYRIEKEIHNKYNLFYS